MTDPAHLPLHIQRDRFDPVPELLRMREQQPVAKVHLGDGMTGWLITRYEDVRQVLSDATTFSNKVPGQAGGDPAKEQDGGAADGFLLSYDPPDHTRLRKMLTPEFTVRRLRRLEPRIKEIVDQHLEALEQAGPPVDLVADFALPIPSLVICELLGVPYADRDEFHRRATILTDYQLTPQQRDVAIQEAREYMAGLVAAQRAAPGEDLIGMLVREHGDEITDRELIGVADMLLLAGHETTANMLGIGTLLLLRNPDQAAEVRAGRILDEAIEEMMRYLTVTHAPLPRLAIRDVVLSGQQIAAGELVLCSLATANRDAQLGEDLDQFDITRKVAAHVAFGHGVHHCIGAPLARMEMRIAYPALLQRFPTLRLAVPYEEVPFREFSFVHGVKSLPVTW